MRQLNMFPWGVVDIREGFVISHLVAAHGLDTNEAFNGERAAALTTYRGMPVGPFFLLRDLFGTNVLLISFRSS